MRFMMTVLNIELPGLHVRRAYHRNRSHSSIGGRITGTGAAGRQGVCTVGSQQSHSEPGMALERDPADPVATALSVLDRGAGR